MAFNHLIGSGFSRWQGEYTPGQKAFLADTTHSSILLSGAYRSGKTEVLAREAIRHCLSFQDAKFGMFRAKLASLKKSTLETVLSLVHPSWVDDWNNSDLTLRFVTGSRIFFLGCDFADRIGSIELTGAGIDEAHEVNPESYGMIGGRLSGSLSPCPTNDTAIAKYQRATQAMRKTTLACNPKNKGHWLYTTFIKADTRKPGHIAYSSNSISNPNLSPDYLLRNLQAYTRPGVTSDQIKQAIIAIRAGEAASDGLFLQPLLTPFGQRNLLGLWVNTEGSIYDLDPEHHIIDTLPEDDPIVERFVGVDFGFHNARAIEVSVLKSGSPVTTRYWSGKNSSPYDVVDILEAWNNATPFNRAYLPHDQPGIYKEAVRRLKNRVARAKVNVLSGIGCVQTFLGHPEARLQFLRVPGKEFDLFWNEMEGYVWRRDKDGNWLDVPEKDGDHYPDALRYSLYTAYVNRGNKTWWQPEKSGEIWTPFNQL